jgi:phage-related protein
MPRVAVVFYRDDDGLVPMRLWLNSIPNKAQAKCMGRLMRLENQGYELRRPEADYLRDDIYELRVDLQGIHYRMLYFYHGQTAAIVSHGLVKERVVPPGEIDLALRRKLKFEQNPKAHRE